MNVYDFDGTIYAGDSSIDFWRFCLRRHPAVLKTCPKLFLKGVQYKLLGGKLEDFKSAFFSFLPVIPNLEAEVTAFWDRHQEKISKWYLDQRRSDDVVISASPVFLLSPICKQLGIEPPIATEIDPTAGKLKGENCKGGEKVRRFLAQYPNAEIQKFYSDSRTDAPLAALAQEAFLVQRNTLQLWTDL